jgi:pimeloyl-ACP methyl ester carboxylesterase
MDRVQGLDESGAAALRRRRAPFVLVHGGRHGGWCWKRVAPLLRAAGHEVFTPTLTGLGERSHLLERGIGLDTHVRDIVQVLFYEDLHDVILVGHSYGGMVVAGAMEHVADRVGFVVFLDAHMPRSGESVSDLTPPHVVTQLDRAAEQEGDGWLVPITDASFWGVEDPEDLAWVNSRVTPQPLKTYQDAVCAENVWTRPGMYVECGDSAHPSAGTARARARSGWDPTFHHRVLASGHEPMVTTPVAVADLLLEAAVLGGDGDLSRTGERR